MKLIKEKTIEEELGVKIKTNYVEINTSSYYSPFPNILNIIDQSHVCIYFMF